MGRRHRPEERAFSEWRGSLQGGLWAEALRIAVVYALLVLIGLYVRSRRQLVASLVLQAESARQEQEAGGERAVR